MIGNILIFIFKVFLDFLIIFLSSQWLSIIPVFSYIFSDELLPLYEYFAIFKMVAM